MPCPTCTDCVEPKPDSCVVYTGEDVPELGLCSGETTLLQLENIIVAKILSIMDGTGITLTPTSCTLLDTLIDGDQSLASLVQVLFTAVCQIDSTVGSLEDQVNAVASFDTSCLTGLSASPTRDQILQALLTKVCSIDTRVSTLETESVKAADLDELIAAYLSAQSASTQQYTKMVPYVAYEYYGPLSNFDSNGKGISSYGFDKVYLCNGQSVGSFTVPDRRGRVGVGAVQSVPGGALDSAVDPTLPANAGTNYAVGQKFGSSFVTLSITQMPSHAHQLTDPGHKHVKYNEPSTKRGGGNDPSGHAKKTPNGDSLGDAYDDETATAKTGITIGAAGGSQPHDNRQPSIAANYIMYVPSN